MCLSICASCASNYWGRVSVDITPSPVAVYRALKIPQDFRRDTARFIIRICGPTSRGNVWKLSKACVD